MPDGTIQDSRMPQSPQWGHLKVKNPNDLNNPPHNDKRQKDEWNSYALFINHLEGRGEPKSDYVKYHKKKVEFDMIDAEIKITDPTVIPPQNNIKVRVAWVKGLKGRKIKMTNKNALWVVALLVFSALVIFTYLNTGTVGSITKLQLLSYVTLGIIISIILPILRSRLPKSKLQAEDSWTVIRPYLIVGLFSLLTSILILAFLEDSITDFKSGLLAGYAWDATLQKIAETD